MHLGEDLPRVSYQTVRDLKLLDTCFFIDLASKRELHKLLNTPIAMTSFNLEELEHVAHRLHNTMKHDLRSFFKEHPNVTIVEVPVHPGDRASEHAFVASVDDSLLMKVRDPSDAVLIAAAIVTKSDVFTKDKHHLFTVQLENYLHAYDIAVHKEWKDAQDNHPQVF